MDKVREVLDKFGGISGQRISYDKSSLLFSNNANDQTGRELPRIAGSRKRRSL